jgi:hypothetical protein
VPGNHDDHGVGIEFSKSLQGFQSVQAGHLDVEENEVGSNIGILGDPFPAGAGEPDFKALILEHLPKRFPDARFVVDNQNPMLHRLPLP